MLKTATQKNPLGKMVYIELSVIAALLLAYITNTPFLVLAAFAMACLLVVFSNQEKSIYYMAFFTSFSSVFVYNGKHMFFVIAGLFILKALVISKINIKTIIYYLVIAAYSLLFCDLDEGFSFAKIIGLILLFAIPVIATYSDKIDCAELMKHYIFGFIIQTIIGYFVMDIPAMIKLFEYDLVYISDFQEATRFFGLAFDSNFYALSNYVVVAYLLFGFKKLSPFRAVLTAFLIISGLQTISKSYLLVLGILLILFVLKSVTEPKRLIATAVVGAVLFGVLVFINNALGYNVVQLTTDRFVEGSFADNTTGRVDIWKNYYEMFNEAGIAQMLFGFGFNAQVEIAAHNTFIEFLFYYGIIGLGIWIAYFIHCGTIFYSKTKAFANKTPMVLCTFLVGIFFLSAYTYEAFWMGIVISLMTLGRASKDGSNIENV